MDIKKFVKDNWTSMSDVDIGAKLGLKAEQVRRIRRNLGLLKPQQGVRVQVEVIANSLSSEVQKVLMKSKRVWSLEDLSNYFNVGMGNIQKAVRELKEKGKNVNINETGVAITPDIPKGKPSVIDTSGFDKKQYRFGVTGDNHLGSKYQRLDVLNALFDIWERAGVATVYQCGNMIDGEARFNTHDLLVHGMQNQINYFVENWPRRKGIVTRFVTGDDHEGWYIQREGVDIGKLIELTAKEKGRDDLVYLGHMEHDVILRAKNGYAIMRVLHAGGGSAYATSYKQQKLVESYQGGEKPQILLIGHYHKMEYGYPREVHAVQVGCTEDQTPFMRKKQIQAHVGGVTIEFTQDDEGIVHGFTPKFDAFYDKGFYDKAWKYHW